MSFFYGKRIKKLETEIERLREQNEQLSKEIQEAKSYKFNTGLVEYVHFPFSISGCEFPVYKHIPIKDVLSALMKNAGIEPTYQGEVGEQVRLQIKPQTEPNPNAAVTK